MTSEEIKKLEEIVRSFGITEYSDVKRILSIRSREEFINEILIHPRTKARRKSDVEKALKDKNLFYKF